MNYYMSDLHLGDPREVLGRPFRTVHEEKEEMFNHLYNIISGDDVLYVIGDFAYFDPKISEPRIWNWLAEFDEATSGCKKILIKGNHDRYRDGLYKEFFKEVVDSYIDLDIQHQDRVLPCRLHHYPTQYSIAERFSLCGHVHGVWKVQKNMLNVSVDVHYFRPINDREVLFYFNAINNFYDEDVWASNHQSNVLHDKRGKAGAYWKTLDKSLQKG